MRVLLSGASGAVGREISGLIKAGRRHELVGIADRSSFFADDVAADVLIDFSHPELTRRCLEFCARQRLPMVIGTTGLTKACRQQIDELSSRIPLCVAANFSVGVTVMMDLAARAAAALPDAFDIEIFESHHRRKIDAPSGTALALGDRVAAARGQDLKASLIMDRSNRHQARRQGEIGFQVSRGGDVVGEHILQFLGDGERLDIVHRATDRSIFARGALLAAEKLLAREAGRVEFSDLLLSNIL